MKDCTKCGLTSPDTALRCDCAYDFPSHTVKQSYLPPKERGVVGSTAIAIVGLLGLMRASWMLYSNGSNGVVPALLSLIGPVLLISAILIWGRNFAYNWHRLTWRHSK